MKGRRSGVLFLIPAALIVFMAHTSAKIPDSTSAQSTAANSASASRRARDAAKWAEATLQKMSVDEKIGQLLFTTYHGELTPTDSMNIPIDVLRTPSQASTNTRATM